MEDNSKSQPVLKAILPMHRHLFNSPSLHIRVIRGLATICISVTVVCSSTFGDDAPDYLRDVRSILAKSCLKCHGPDEGTREAGLRLDEPSGLFASIDGRTIVAKGDAQHSELARRILSTDPDEQMPPADSGKSLTEQQKQTLIRWIESGAMWEQHWAFVGPVKPQVPTAESAASAKWVRNEIDDFILAAQSGAGLSPSPPADGATLVRRLFLDLIGLPPTVEEAEHWVSTLSVKAERNQTAAGEPLGSVDDVAYSELVDHLLARSEYGERWARHWLDLARYADTNGYEKDRPRSIWPYRDWVIGALNDDMPFDQFTIEQLAGDILPGATRSQKIATGFHRNTMLNEEGGIDPLEFRFHAMTDRVATTGATWLGLTIGCAQCHTHKYDPISHREYYQLFAFLNNADEPSLALPGPDSERQAADNQHEAERLLEELPAHWPMPPGDSGSDAARRRLADQRFSEWLIEQRRTAVIWTALTPVAATSNLPQLTIQADASVLASGDTTKQDYYEIRFAPSVEPVTALRLEALPDDRLPGRGPGTTFYEGAPGDFFLSEITVEAEGLPVALHSATESYTKNKFGNTPVSAALTLDRDVQTGWSVAAAEGERHTAVYLLSQPLPPSQSLTVKMTFGRHFASSLGRFRVSAATGDRLPVARRMPAETEQLLTFDDSALTAEQQQQLFRAFLLNATELAEHAETIRRLQAPPETDTTLVLQERPPENPRPAFRHHRGEYLQPAEQVTPATPAILHAWPAELTRDRLGFARWLVDRRNPLTARVVVNRQWAALFGRGIVPTVDDFGIQGTAPTHPELIDWLAVTFMDDDRWSLKKLHRRMVLSAAWRQTATRRVDAIAVDPENALLAFSRRPRLDAEVIRDSIMKAAGVLSGKRGGPPVRPLQPAGITEVTFGSPAWNVSTGEDRYRRSIYTFIKRTAPFAMVTTFDGPSGEACIARRSRSNTPLQALTLMNDPMFIDLAQASGRSLAAMKDISDEDRVILLFRRLLTRFPVDEERSMLTEFVTRQREAFTRQPELAASVSGTETGTSEPAASAVEIAVWTAMSRTIFSLDESVTRP